MSSTPFMHRLAAQIEPHLMRIEKVLGSDYRLTLIARNVKNQNAHVVLSIDDTSLAVEALRYTEKNGAEVRPDE